MIVYNFIFFTIFVHLLGEFTGVYCLHVTIILAFILMQTDHLSRISNENAPNPTNRAKIVKLQRKQT